MALHLDFSLHRWLLLNAVHSTKLYIQSYSQPLSMHRARGASVGRLPIRAGVSRQHLQHPRRQAQPGPFALARLCGL